MTEVDVIIEIAKGSHIKYEYDKQVNMIICDRILHTPMKYPFNYGFIPNTLSEDRDPLDVVVLMDHELIPGSMIRCKILGYLETRDDAGNDPKIIVCPIEKVDPIWKNNDNLFDEPILNINNNLYFLKINPHILTRIKYFFEHYKDLENKKVEVGNFYNKEEALKIYKDSLDRYKYNSCQKTKITDFFDRI